MSAPSLVRQVRHFFTVDVEDYFHVSAFEGVVSRDNWHQYPVRLAHSVPRLLETLDSYGVRGTFFVLGWVARHWPHIVKAIATAGHEVASHGFWHHRVNRTSPAEFGKDIRASKRCLEDLVGQSVQGYRAPSFSITPGTEWAFDVLLDEGFVYDSSLFPIRRQGYGFPNAARAPHVISRPNGLLFEFPLATTRMLGVTLPAAGGGYLRHLPAALVHRAFRQASTRRIPAVFYVHPWEIDSDQPRLAVDLRTRIRHYRGISRTLPRIHRLLTEFSFTSIRSYMASTPKWSGGAVTALVPQ
jgi:polysaccharide deacetylase family protein (PEP-CTERM system associated)